MLIILLLFALFRLLQGAPLASGEEKILDFMDSDHFFSRSNIVFGHRDTSSIVVSCLATVFACTWTAIHPNIPSPKDSGWAIFKRRIFTTIYALLAPEAITAWAMRQHFAAKRIAREYNKDIAKCKRRKLFQIKDIKNPPGANLDPESDQRPLLSLFLSSIVEWPSKLLRSVQNWFISPTLPPEIEGERPVQPWTITHGFFVQMGGFILSKNGRPIQTLEYQSEKAQSIHQLITSRELDPPTITRADIDDRSKGDFISKSFIVLQTTWFIAQCIARWSVKIPVTELEVVTLGFAVLNGITYALWWDKPQSVSVPVYLEWRSPTKVDSQDTEKVDILQASNSSPTNIGDDTKHEINEESQSENASGPVQATVEPANVKNTQSPDSFLEVVFVLLLFVAVGPLIPLAKMLQLEKEPVKKGKLRVPMFHSDSTGFDTITIFTPSMAIAAIFGCVHLIPAWFLDFPTQKEMWLWRISACLITGLPAVLGLAMHGMSRGADDGCLQCISVISGIPAFIALPFYIVARIMLIVLALISLKHLPDSAHLTIEWISLIPHL